MEKAPAKKKKPLVAVLCILAVLVLLGGGCFFVVTQTDLLSGLSDAENAENTEKEETAEEETDENEESEDAAADEDLMAALEEDLAPVAEQVAAAENKMADGDYAGASADLEEVLNTYADLVAEYDSDDVTDEVSPLAETAFDLYTQSVLKQIESWESQSPTAPLHQQIIITYDAASALAVQLQDAGLTVSTNTLDEDYADFPARYKEKYILAFNDLFSEESWSRTTAWMYMQDASSVGLVDNDNPDDPLTLRYSFALAWITQKNVSEGRNDGSLTDEEAIAAILAVVENADYNPVLIKELALCYDSAGDSGKFKTLQEACVNVRNYLANSQNTYINGEDLLVPGGSTNASSSIALNDFWYFNDLGEYSPAGSTNGINSEGRTKVREICRQAIDSL